MSKGKLTTIPFGPQHPVLPEAVQLQFFVDEEKIVDVLPNLGYIHRGIEKAAELNDYRRNLYLCERICGICNIIHGQSYAGLIEKLTDTEIPIRAKYLRTIWSELARLQSHLLTLGLFADTVGFESVFMKIWKDRELILELTEATNGHRVHLGTTIIGGVNKDMDEKLQSRYLKDMDILTKEINDWADVFSKDKAYLDRTVGKGILPKKDAVHLGAVGPVIRGSGIAQDMRNNGYEAYGQLEFEPITHEGCDVQARTWVKVEECYQSIDLIKQAIKTMPEGPIAVKNTKFPEGEAIYRTEQPRGELFYYGKGNGTIHMERVRIRTPTIPNLPPLLQMLIGYDVADIPAIVHSIDPCMSCTERITDIKEMA